MRTARGVLAPFGLKKTVNISDWSSWFNFFSNFFKKHMDRGQTVDTPWNARTGTWKAHTGTWKGHTGTWTWWPTKYVYNFRIWLVAPIKHVNSRFKNLGKIDQNFVWQVESEPKLRIVGGKCVKTWPIGMLNGKLIKTSYMDQNYETSYGSKLRIKYVILFRTFATITD